MTAPTRPASRLDPDELAALEEQRDFLLGSLDDLERERDAGDIDEHDYETLRNDYTARAAEVLRALDERRQAFTEARRTSSTGRIVAIVAGVLVFSVVAGVLVAQALGGRAPDQTVTGGIRQTPSQDAKRCIDKIQPGGDPRPALQCFQSVLKRDPQNPVALAYQGWTLNLTVMTTSNLPPATAKQFRTDAAHFVAKAVRADAQYPDALAFAAIIAYQQGKYADAQRSLRALDKSHPPADITALIKQFGLRENIAKQLRAQEEERLMAIRLGGGQGFYGDGHEPVGDLLDAGVDYLICEALAELTLAILQKDRQRDEALGWTRDLPLYVHQALPWLLDRRTRLITNAGGINPVAAGRAVVGALREADAGGLKVATVVGDDVRGHAAELGLPDDSLFANAYLGARPIVDALDAGADIVITGRVADASLFLAPLVHEHGWAWDDWDRLAAGVAVGHLLECSGQVTGGNWSGPWWENPDPTRIGFPIGEVEGDGSVVITKPDGTGGRVSFDTVREQLLYEVHDPRSYLNPDATADFTSLRVEDLGTDRVRVSGAKGGPPPATYKGLVCTPAGWAGEARLAYSWPDAEAKASAALAFIRNRAEQRGLAVDEWHQEFFGAGAFGGPTLAADRTAAAAAGWDPPEVIGRLAWRCSDPAVAGQVAQGVGVLGLSGPPTIAGTGRSRDGKPTQLLAVEPFAVDRALVDAQVRIEVTEV